MNESKIGKVGVCSTGRVGLIVAFEEVTFQNGETKGVFTGIGLDGKGLWCSSDPLILHNSIEDYIARLKKCLTQPGCVYPPLGSGALNPIGA